MNNPNHISAVGLGKLGMSFAITLASRGFQVIGTDINKVSAQSLKKGNFPIYEAKIKELWNKKINY